MSDRFIFMSFVLILDVLISDTANLQGLPYDLFNNKHKQSILLFYPQ